MSAFLNRIVLCSRHKYCCTSSAEVEDDKVSLVAAQLGEKQWKELSCLYESASRNLRAVRIAKLRYRANRRPVWTYLEMWLIYEDRGLDFSAQQQRSYKSPWNKCPRNVRAGRVKHALPLTGDFSTQILSGLFALVFVMLNLNLCAPVPNHISEAEDGSSLKKKKKALLLFQAKEDRED